MPVPRLLATPRHSPLPSVASLCDSDGSWRLADIQRLPRSEWSIIRQVAQESGQSFHRGILFSMDSQARSTTLTVAWCTALSGDSVSVILCYPFSTRRSLVVSWEAQGHLRIGECSSPPTVCTLVALSVGSWRCPIWKVWPHADSGSSSQRRWRPHGCAEYLRVGTGPCWAPGLGPRCWVGPSQTFGAQAAASQSLAREGHTCSM